MKRRILGALGIGLITFAFWFFLPRHADLRAFDPQAMAKIEADSWRHYYAKDWTALCGDLYCGSRNQYGFSPWQSFRIAFYAARSAMVFQPTRTRIQAMDTLRWLKAYYRVIRDSTGMSFDTLEAADSELEWWQQRREDVPWQEYGLTIARNGAVVYGLPVESARESALLRAEMMDYRDSKGRDIQPEDWRHIEEQLTLAWTSLAKAVRQ